MDSRDQSGQIHYFMRGGQGGQGGPGGRGGGTSAASEITTWVQANLTAQTVGGSTVYDLTTAT